MGCTETELQNASNGLKPTRNPYGKEILRDAIEVPICSYILKVLIIVVYDGI